MHTFVTMPNNGMFFFDYNDFLSNFAVQQKSTIHTLIYESLHNIKVRIPTIVES